MANHPAIETHHHVVPIRFYAMILFFLFVLMVITVAVGYNQFQTGFWFLSATMLNQLIALAVAFTKATLVVLFFMGARWSTNLTRLWTLCGFVFVTLFTIIAADYGTRQNETVQGWEQRESALPRTVLEPDQQPLVPPDEVNVRPRQ
jgi:caa(3)-type oxidase subunit IV